MRDAAKYLILAFALVALVVLAGMARCRKNAALEKFKTEQNVTIEKKHMKKIMGNEKPLFIPLCREWFERFERGEKTTEYRVYGPRWNERTCRIGRPVVLSMGYGKARRLHGKITRFCSVEFEHLPDEVADFFHALDFDIYAAISVKLDSHQKTR